MLDEPLFIKSSRTGSDAIEVVDCDSKVQFDDPLMFSFSGVFHDEPIVVPVFGRGRVRQPGVRYAQAGYVVETIASFALQAAAVVPVPPISRLPIQEPRRLRSASFRRVGPLLALTPRFPATRSLSPSPRPQAARLISRSTAQARSPLSCTPRTGVLTGANFANPLTSSERRRPRPSQALLNDGLARHRHDRLPRVPAVPQADQGRLSRTELVQGCPLRRLRVT